MKHTVIMALLTTSNAVWIDIKRSTCGDDTKVQAQVAAAIKVDTESKTAFTAKTKAQSDTDKKSAALNKLWSDAKAKYETSKAAADKTDMETAYANYNSTEMRKEEADTLEAFNGALADVK